MTPAISLIIDHMERFATDWCIYEIITGENDECIYLGICKLTAIFEFPDARRNSVWRERVKDRTVISVRIIAIGERRECYNEHGRQVLTKRPVCNMTGYDTIGMVTQITCNETGRTWQTQAECSAALELNQGQLSNHLAGKRGYNRVKGYTFRRGS